MKVLTELMRTCYEEGEVNLIRRKSLITGTEIVVDSSSRLNASHIFISTVSSGGMEMSHRFAVMVTPSQYMSNA